MNSYLEQRIWTALQSVMDPELDCNIVDLGLIYELREESGEISIAMTATSRGCPMMESLRSGVEHAVSVMDGVNAVAVNWVWDPPWHPSMMTEAGRTRTGVVTGEC